MKLPVITRFLTEIDNLMRQNCQAYATRTAQNVNPSVGNCYLLCELIEIGDELLMLVFAGYETTTSALVWALYWVLVQPIVKQRIEAELQQLADPDDAWVSDDNADDGQRQCLGGLSISPSNHPSLRQSLKFKPQ
ncbi:cytochrome P450 [Microcoleus sp. FACHB-1515]|uniref:cytochrome P450 n=1 Tax=Leptolyngbya sp. FACHB-1515 TaxID=2933931 RepID=UPI001682D390|nr:cytochrome P450 [Microcoleus sp. FACHB-1515]MBD2088258.1 cytochrome P450 [Microcoleus sp. FACHB-1515]